MQFSFLQDHTTLLTRQGSPLSMKRQAFLQGSKSRMVQRQLSLQAAIPFCSGNSKVGADVNEQAVA